MRISDHLTRQLLSSSSEVSDEQIASLLPQVVETGLALQDLAVGKGIISESELTKLYAQHIGVPYIDLDATVSGPSALASLPQHVALMYKAVVYENDTKTPKVAMADPTDLQAIAIVRKYLGKAVKVFVADESVITLLLSQQQQPTARRLETHVSLEPTPDESKPQDATLPAETVDHLLQMAIEARASSIHIEPQEHLGIVRLRIDGRMHTATKLPKRSLAELSQYVQEAAGLTDSRMGQPGQLQRTVNDTVYHMEVVVAPVLDGDKITLRLLPTQSTPPSLLALGFWGPSLVAIENGLAVGHGLIIASGPSGSGRHTTLFAMLNLLNAHTSHIATIEERPSYKLPDVSQSYTNSFLSHSLRDRIAGVLAHDPDVLLISTLQDKSVAQQSIQSAASGKLVLSTTTAPRALNVTDQLLRLGCSEADVNHVLLLTIAQRLLPKLCSECRISYRLNKLDTKQLNELFHIENSQTEARISKLVQEYAGVVKAETPNSQEITTLWRVNTVGCEACHHTGYKGQLSINEVLDKTRDGSQALQQGTLPMEIDGFIKALVGEISLDDLYRVLQINPLTP